MAGRVNTYQLFRKIHMYAAFITMAFLVMYFGTGYLMNRWQWFDETAPEPVLQMKPVQLPEGAHREMIASSLQRQLDISGRFVNSWENRSTTYYEFQSVKRQTIVSLEADGQSARVKVSDKNALGQVTAYHRMHKYGGPIAYNLYILMMDLASAALLVFTITGICMWLGLARYRWLGIACLATGIAYTLWVWLSFIFY